jgi:hypothetical protein
LIDVRNQAGSIKLAPDEVNLGPGVRARAFSYEGTGGNMREHQDGVNAADGTFLQRHSLFDEAASKASILPCAGDSGALVDIGATRSTSLSSGAS